MTTLKAAELQLSQGQEKAVRRILELVSIHDHSKEKARYIFSELNIAGVRRLVY